MKKLLSLLFLSFLLFSSLCSADQERLIFDQTPQESLTALPNHFRQFENTLGSAQFNKSQLENIIHKIPGPIYVVDLRQETHAFINNSTPVSLYGQHDWANKNLSNKEIDVKEKQFIQQLSQTEPHVISEKQLVESLGLHYIHIPVTDHMGPTPEDVNNFLNFYKQLPPNATVYFHCHGGDGRTTTFLVMADILHNAKKDSFETILMRQYKLGGENLLNIPKDKPQWFTDAAKQRLVFLQDFYEQAAHPTS